MHAPLSAIHGLRGVSTSLYKSLPTFLLRQESRSAQWAEKTLNKMDSRFRGNYKSAPLLCSEAFKAYCASHHTSAYQRNAYSRTGNRSLFR